MRSLVLASSAALVGLALVGLMGGDPRGVRLFAEANRIALAGAVVAVAVGALAWYGGRRLSAWLLVPTVILALAGGLSGWISAAEITGEPDVAVKLAAQPGRALFMLALTAAGMVLPSLLVTWIAGRVRRRDTART